VKAKLKRGLKLFFLFFFLSWFSTNITYGLAEVQEENTTVEGLLSYAEKLCQDGEYNRAVEIYLRAVDQAQRKIDLSRAYLGLSLSFYYLRDLTNTEKWIRKVLEVDPKKEISILFYPQSFVELFFRIKEEEKEIIVKVPEKKQAEVKEQSEENLENKIAKPDISTLPSTIDAGVTKLEKGKEGNWEIEVHYSLWTIDMIIGLVEGRVNEEAEEELSKEISKQITKNHITLKKDNYEQDLKLDSSGSNYGFGIRFYPKGKKGSFSLGLSFEQTKIKLSFQGQAKQEFKDGSYAEADAGGFFEASLFSTNLSFRWDMKPSWRVTPYFVLGFGLAPLKGNVSYFYSGSYYWAGPQESIEYSELKTLKELEEEIDYNIPSIFFILQMNFGIRGEILPNFYIRAEAGFWDGLLFRGGLAFKF